jgi:RNA polymerase sigma-70 factor (ECF subfamily)
LEDSAWIHAALQKYEGSLVQYARRLTGDLERARDVVQDTFLKLCAAERAKVEPHLAEWLFTVCRNGALDVLKKERRRAPLEDGAASERDSMLAERTVVPDPAAAVEAREEGARAMQALARLPFPQQEALRLKFQSGMSYREIAEITGQPIGTVGWLIHFGLKALRERLAVDGGLAVAPARAQGRVS